MKNNNNRVKKRRVIALLNREEMEFLERLGLNSLFSTGRKLSRVAIISALIDAAMAIGISAKGIKSKKELVQKILDAMRAPIERRKYPRLKKNLMVGFRKMDSMGPYKRSVTEDAGMGGFRTEVSFLNQPLAINQLIEITINDPKEGGKPVQAIGRVAWMKEHEDGQAYEIGIMLTYIKKEDKERFIKYLIRESDTESKTGLSKGK